MNQTAAAVERAFGTRIRELRKARGWSQADLADRMNAAGFPMHQTTVAKLESASRPTPVGEVVVLAALFGLSPASLVS